MSKLFTCWSIAATAILIFAAPSWGQGKSQKAIVHAETRHDLSPRLSSMVPRMPEQHAPEVRENERIVRGGRKALTQDTAVQSAPTQTISTTGGTTFEGVGNAIYGYTVASAPPDPNGSAGLTQYVQWVNTSFAVFDKSNGALLYGPAAGSTLWSGFGGPCETKDDGDPIVQYDKIAHRWVMSQFANVETTDTGPYYECVAVSQTEDATGSWYRYQFTYTRTSGMTDYPKMAVWRDAYYVTYNMFDSSQNFTGAQACALDRTSMLAGNVATQQCFLLDPQYGAVLPSDLDGNTLPPSGSPDYLIAYQTDGSTSSLDLFKFHVDFTTPANSTLTGPTAMSVTAFNEACTGSPCDTNIVPQPGTTTKLDTLGDRPMYRLAYRNFGDHEALVVNHSVLTGTGKVGVRWYELRDPNGTPTVYQQSTFAPDSSYRWMGSIAMDNSGDIAVGYSLGSSTVYPSIAYTGRLSTDTLNQLGTENSIFAGTASQTTYSCTGGNACALNRWGDYTSMSVDPNDDCTFWYTNQYEPSNGSFNWRTKIASFKFPSCTSAAAMVSPQAGNTFSGTSATFSWTKGTGAVVYWMWIGSAPGTNTYYDASQQLNTSVTVDTLPVNGSTVYVRLFTWINGGWQYRDYTYTAANFPPVAATMSSPTQGSTLTSASATFQWSKGTNVTSYWMWIGTTGAGSLNLYDASQSTRTSLTLNSLPTSGGTLYVRLFSLINGAWQYNDYTYTEANIVPVPATMTSPTQGSTLPGTSATFMWTTGTSVSSYWMWIGTQGAGSLNLYDAGQGTNTSVTVSNLPALGATIYVRLFSWINGAWQYRDYTYKEASTPATMITPVNGSTLSGSSVQFTWNPGGGVTSYWLWVGTSPGTYSLCDCNEAKNTSATVNGLPTSGVAIYVRLFSYINGAWQYNDYSYVTGP